MAVIINPSDTLEKPTLNIASENQFGKVVATNISKILEGEYTIRSNNNIDIFGTPISWTKPDTTNLDNVKGYTEDDYWIQTNYINLTNADFQYETNDNATNILTSTNTNVSCSVTKSKSLIQTDEATNTKYRITYLSFHMVIVFDSIATLANIKSVSAKVLFSSGSKALYANEGLNNQVFQRNAENAIALIFPNNKFVSSLLSKLGTRTYYKYEKSSSTTITIDMTYIIAYQIKYGTTYGGFIMYKEELVPLVQYKLLSKVSDTNSFVYGDSLSSYSLEIEDNPFIFQSTLHKGQNQIEYNSELIFKRYANGKHYGNITIKIGNYYNESSSLVYSPSSKTMKYIGVGETVIPYIYDKSNNVVPLLTKDNNAVDFVVMESKLVFNNGIMSLELGIMEK